MQRVQRSRPPAAERLVMAGGRGAGERAEGPPDTGKLRQLRPVKTEEAVVFKPQAQTIHKQLQVGCLTASASVEPRLHAGMLAMQIRLCNRSQLSLPAVSQHLMKTC